MQRWPLASPSEAPEASFTENTQPLPSHSRPSVEWQFSQAPVVTDVMASGAVSRDLLTVKREASKSIPTGVHDCISPVDI